MKHRSETQSYIGQLRVLNRAAEQLIEECAEYPSERAFVDSVYDDICTFETAKRTRDTIQELSLRAVRDSFVLDDRNFRLSATLRRDAYRKGFGVGMTANRHLLADNCDRPLERHVRPALDIPPETPVAHLDYYLTQLGLYYCDHPADICLDDAPDIAAHDELANPFAEVVDGITNELYHTSDHPEIDRMLFRSGFGLSRLLHIAHLRALATSKHPEQ